jgi:hypothetical protein
MDSDTYRLHLTVSNDMYPGKTGSPDFCDGLNDPEWLSTGTASLVLQSTPRYLTFVQASLVNPAPSSSAVANALVIDSQTGSTILLVSNKSFTAPGWFNSGAAKRFGFGAVRQSTGTQIPFDNFSGNAS